jgi:hypothetical protein
LGDLKHALRVLEALPPRIRSGAPVLERLETYRARLEAAQGAS